VQRSTEPMPRSSSREFAGDRPASTPSRNASQQDWRGRWLRLSPVARRRGAAPIAHPQAPAAATATGGPPAPVPIGRSAGAFLSASPEASPSCTARDAAKHPRLAASSAASPVDPAQFCRTSNHQVEERMLKLPRNPVAIQQQQLLAVRAPRCTRAHQQAEGEGGAHVHSKVAQCRTGSIGSKWLTSAQPQPGARHRSECHQKGAMPGQESRHMIIRAGPAAAAVADRGAGSLNLQPAFATGSRQGAQQPHALAALQLGPGQGGVLGAGNAAQRPAAKRDLCPLAPNAKLRASGAHRPRIVPQRCWSDKAHPLIAPMGKTPNPSDVELAKSKFGAVGLALNFPPRAHLVTRSGIVKMRSASQHSSSRPASIVRVVGSMWFPRLLGIISPRPLKRWMCNWPCRPKTIERLF